MSMMRGTVRRQVTGANGEKMLEVVNQAQIVSGRVLMAVGEKITMPSGNVKENKSVKDAYGREYFGVPVEIEPGYDRNIYSCDPVVVEKIKAAKKGDIVNVTGVKRRSGAIRVTSFEIVTPATAPVAGVTQNQQA